MFLHGQHGCGKDHLRFSRKGLVPVTLELGGKKPLHCGSDADIKTNGAKDHHDQIFQAGQMCVGAGLCMVHSSVKEKLVEELKKCIQAFFGDDTRQSDYYGRIINERPISPAGKIFEQRKITGRRQDRSGRSFYRTDFAGNK